MRELKSYRYRIYLTETQKIKFRSLYNQNVFLFNKLIDEKNKRIALEQDEAIYVKSFVTKFKELDNGNFVSYLSTYKLVNKIFDRFHLNKLTPMYKNSFKYPKKIHFDIFSSGFSLAKNRIFVPHLGSFKARIHRDLPENCRIYSSIIEEKLKNQFYINFLVERDLEVKKVYPKTAIGLDYSSPHLFYSSEIEPGDDYKIINFNENKISKIKRKMSRCVSNSKNYYKLKEKEEKLYDEVARKRANSLHLASLYCVKTFDVIGVETLDLEGMAQRNHLGRNVYANSVDKFCKYLSYKAYENGKYFVKVPKYFPSTRLCSQCGVIHKRLLLSDRTFICDCGLKIDRDLNAAINIREKALSMLKDKKNEYRRTL